jgi:hypothetical protein
MGCLGTNEVEHRCRYINSGDLRVAAAEREQQPLLALQPRGRPAYVPTGGTDMHAHQLISGCCR